MCWSLQIQQNVFLRLVLLVDECLDAAARCADAEPALAAARVAAFSLGNLLLVAPIKAAAQVRD
jgi:hypothetical protein